MLDLQKALTVATDAAQKAGKVIEEGLQHEVEFSLKTDPADRLTQTDIDAQNIIFDALRTAYPDHTLIGEEDTGEAPQKESSYRWIVDPLDGTMNFTHSLPFCGTSIALEVEGEATLGVLNFPALGTLYTGIKGEGAQKNGNPIRLRPCEKLEDAMLAEIFSDRETRGTEVRYPPVTAYRKFGSAIASLAFLAEGSIDGTVLRCRIWDIAAGKVILEEAGAQVTVWLDDETDIQTPLTCIASGPAIHESLCTFAKENIGTQKKDK